MYDSIDYIDIDLNQISAWRDDLDSLEHCKSTFGFLGFILHEYYQTYRLEIFDRYKTLIESNFIDSLCSSKLVPTFFGRLEKIFLLQKYWNENNKWRDPLVARSAGIKNNKPFYHTHPGRDRYFIMKAHGVQTYRFLYIPDSFLNMENKSLIESFWGDYQHTLIIQPSEIADRISIGSRDTSQYTKYINLIEWLKQ